jgi:hypothetical protein
VRDAAAPPSGPRSSCAGDARRGRRGRGIRLLLRRRIGRHTRKRVVRVELVARRGERLRRRARDADAHDDATQPLAALRERDVVAVAGDDHDVGEVGEAEHVLDGVDGQADVGAVLRVRRRGEQLHEVDGARDQLRTVERVDRRRPVGVGAREHEGAEGCRVVDDRPDIDRGVLQRCAISGVGVGDDLLAVGGVGLRPCTRSYQLMTMLSKSR